MNKLLFILSGLLIIILVVTGIYYFQLKTPSEIPKEEKIAKELELQKQVGEIVKAKDFEKCDKVEDDMYKDVCTNNIALILAQETLDVSYCQKLDNKLMSIESCEFDIVSQKSLKEENVKLCEGINNNLKNLCLELYWQKLSYEKGSIQSCDVIQTEQVKNYCYDSYLFQREFIKNPSDFDCQKFDDSQLKIDCQTYQDNLKENLPACNGLQSLLFSRRCSLDGLK